MRRRPSANSQRGPLRHPTGEGLATRIAFTVIVLFVLAQVGWWLMFQTQLLDRAASEREAAWARDLATVADLLEADPVRLDALLARYPHLRRAETAPGAPPAVEVDPAVADHHAARDRSARRMISFEGPFFALVILAMLALIATSLRAERELKRRQQNFLSAVTHEFNTPIGTLRLLVQTLRLRRASPERRSPRRDGAAVESRQGGRALKPRPTEARAGGGAGTTRKDRIGL